MPEPTPTTFEHAAQARGTGVPRGGVPAGDGGRPSFVSVVVPCFNEERFIAATLEGLARQYEPGRFEIIVVDGRSTDRTRAVVEEFAARHPDSSVRVVDNPARDIPTALNLGVAAARGEIVVRMDAHSVPSANYVRRCVELLGAGAAEVVGMPWRIRAGADTAAARAVALAVAHPFGIGDAKYRLPESAAAGLVDTVPFGVFRKELWRSLGGFNEELLANEDYDFNYRVRQSGGRVLLDTAEHCVYFARPSFTELARQYFRYGRWKAQMLKLHPRSVRWRHLVAPGFVSSVVLLSLAAPAWRFAAWALAALLGSYVTLAIFCAARLSLKAGAVRLLPHVAFAFPVLHVSWGCGFWLGLARAPRRAVAQISRAEGRTG